MNDKLPVTLVVPHWNRPDELVFLFESMKRLVYKPEKMIVVDDASDIPLPVLPEDVQVIKMSRHAGTPTAKNIGLIACDTEFIWFLDSDTEIINPYMLLDALHLQDEPLTGIVGGEFRIGEDHRIGMQSTSCRRDGTGVESFVDGTVRHVFENDIIPTANFLVRADLLRRVHGFVDIMYLGEDSLASLMIKRLGYKNICSSKFAVIHHRSASGNNNPEKTLTKGFTCRAFLYGAYCGTNVWVYYFRLAVTLFVCWLRRRLGIGDLPNFEGKRLEDSSSKKLSKLDKIRAIAKIDTKALLAKGRAYAESII